MDTAVRELAEWAAEELPTARQDSEFLQRFLQGCKLRQPVARHKLRNFVGLRTITPQWFTGRDPTRPEVAALLTQGIFMPLPRKDEAGRTVIYIRATIHDHKRIPINDVFKTSIMVLDAAFEEDEDIAEKGVVVIIDLTGVSMGHAWQMTPTIIRRAVYSWQDCYPIRIKGMHFINCPLHVDVVLKIIKSFMRDKLRSRVHTHGSDLSKLHALVDPALLPEDLGGSGGPLQPIIQHWKDTTTGKRDWFLEQEAAGS